MCFIHYTVGENIIGPPVVRTVKCLLVQGKKIEKTNIVIVIWRNRQFDNAQIKPYFWCINIIFVEFISRLIVTTINLGH